MATAQTARRPIAAPPAAPSVKTPAKSSTVTVACKISTGLDLQLCKPTTWIEETPSGSRERVRYDRIGKLVNIRGPAYPVGMIPKGMRPRPQMAGGYALTPNVDAEFFDEWMRQNVDNPIVLEKLILVHSEHASVAAEAREHRDVLSGMEPIVPDTDPRLPRSVNPNVENIKTADEFKTTMMPADSEAEE